MAHDPTPPEHDEADPDDRTTPAGRAGDLEDLAEDTGAEAAPDADTDAATD